MDSIPYREPSPGLHDEERRRQLVAELEHAERERRAALLMVADAEAHAHRVRHALADVAPRPVHLLPDGAGAPSARTPGPDIVDVRSAPVSGALLGNGSPRLRRAALLERFLEARDPRRSRRRILVLLGVAIVLVSVLVTSRVASFEDVGEQVYSRWILPQVRPEGEPDPALPWTPELVANSPAAAIVIGFAAKALSDLDFAELGPESIAPGDSWLTAAYRVRPTQDPSVQAHGRALVTEARRAQAAMPPLADADVNIRAEFATAGINSEGLAQEAVKVYRTIYRVVLERAGAQVALGEAIIALDAHLRAHQGSLTYRLGEYHHPDADLVRDATALEASVTRCAATLLRAEALARATVGDLGVPGQ